MGDELLGNVTDGVATLTLNRPERRNALNAALLGELAGWLERLEADRNVRVIVVRAAGRAFCSGMDLNELRARQSDAADPEAHVTRVLQQLERSRHPTLAMVQGDAFAGGCQLAIHCDLRVAADTARFAMPLGRLGLVVPFPLGRKLVEVVGAAHAREILLVGAPVDARRAHEIGLVHRVVAAEALEATTLELARALADNAPLSMAGIKAGLLRATGDAAAGDHADLDELARRARLSADAREGVAAMLARRRPVFRGE
jgi:enoyl-CoA hydratase/carnithine racemase